MKYIKSTYEVLAWRVIGRGVDEKWVDWAIDMLSEGFETEHLIILAGELKPYDQFYLKDLISKVFRELNLETSNVDRIIANYVLYLVDEVQSGIRNPIIVLGRIQDLHYDYDFQDDLSDFWCLYWAVEDLKYSEVQWYWPDADRSNITSIIDQYFKDWFAQHEYLPM